ncbi:hypothetical protein [Lentimicrobium sp. S6]|uniref:hypothetical protein n=1 Tax=Lentimicrobium sp. S6 TaxID=2735872 RepID=UPI00155448A7|nr:hypothetical protein [Lentimicrobium sp. S6]NPD44522.1 hypothetical protein [Lentimicrobium sp. S6]
MRKLLFTLLIGLMAHGLFAQKFYTTSGGELILSLAEINSGDAPTPQNIVRFSPWFNVQSLGNVDFGDHAGMFFGLNVRNVGFIAKDNSTQVKKKYRVYNLGIPVGFKLGNMDSFFVYGGYEFELPFNYKEKTFENEVKTGKFNVWFSDRVPTYYHSVFVGFQFPYGANLKFKYYLTPFHNADFVEKIDGVDVKPYENFETNVFYLALSFTMFRNSKVYYKSSNSHRVVVEY